MGCTDPLSSRGVGAPHQCPLGVGSKLPLPLDADVHTYILMTQHIPLGTSAPQVGRLRAGSFLFYILKKNTSRTVMSSVLSRMYGRLVGAYISFMLTSTVPYMTSCCTIRVCSDW